jgi:hypothetical protein
MGKMLILVGLGIVALGLLVVLLNKLNVPLGHLPGDAVWRGKNATVYFPWVTCLILSLLGSLVLWFLNRR